MPPTFLEADLSAGDRQVSVHRSRLEVKRVRILPCTNWASWALGFAGSPLTNTSEGWSRDRGAGSGSELSKGDRANGPEIRRVGKVFALRYCNVVIGDVGPFRSALAPPPHAVTTVRQSRQRKGKQGSETQWGEAERDRVKTP